MVPLGSLKMAAWYSAWSIDRKVAGDTDLISTVPKRVRRGTSALGVWDETKTVGSSISETEAGSVFQARYIGFSKATRPSSAGGTWSCALESIRKITRDSCSFVTGASVKMKSEIRGLWIWWLGAKQHGVVSSSVDRSSSNSRTVESSRLNNLGPRVG